jgi:glutamate decarboxylase
MPTFALNFSRPGAQVCAQYYNFVRLGREGYTRVQQRSIDTARGLADRIEAMPQFRNVTGELDMPVFAFALEDGIDSFTVFDVSRELRARGWQVPAYTMPANIGDEAVLRIVIRNGFSRDMGDLLMADLERGVSELETHGGHPSRRHEAFRH